jgi:hypothetical protein
LNFLPNAALIFRLDINAIAILEDIIFEQLSPVQPSARPLTPITAKAFSKFPVSFVTPKKISQLINFSHRIIILDRVKNFICAWRDPLSVLRH